MPSWPLSTNWRGRLEQNNGGIANASSNAINAFGTAASPNFSRLADGNAAPSRLNSKSTPDLAGCCLEERRLALRTSSPFGIVSLGSPPAGVHSRPLLSTVAQIALLPSSPRHATTHTENTPENPSHARARHKVSFICGMQASPEGSSTGQLHSISHQS